MTWLRPVERLLYRLGGLDPDEDQHWTQYAGGDADLQSRFDAADLHRAAAAARPAVQSAELPGRGGPAGVRDLGLVHDQHQLAVVLGRVDDVVLLPDDSARLPQLHLGRGGRGGRGRAGSGHRPALRGASGELLGRSGARDAVPLPPAVAHLRPDPRAAGRHPEFPPLSGRPDARGRQADHRHGSGREPGGDQGDRHQRRRILQRELGARVREPDAADQLPPAAGDLPDLGRAHLDLRPAW